MPKFSKSFPTDNARDARALYLRFVGVDGGTIRRVKQDLPNFVNIDIGNIETGETGVLATIDAPDIAVARTIVARLTEIATSDPVRGFYSPSSTRREFVGMLFGKKKVNLKRIGKKNNVKILYKGRKVGFMIEGISRVDVDNAIRDLQYRDKKAQEKLAGQKVINLDDDVPGLPASLPPAVINLDNVSGVAVSLPLETVSLPLETRVMDHVVAGAGAADDIPSLQRTWTTPDGTLGGEDPVMSELVRAITGMLEQSGKFNDCSPENTLRMMNCAKRIAYKQLVRNVEWEQMILGAANDISEL